MHSPPFSSFSAHLMDFLAFWLPAGFSQWKALEGGGRAGGERDRASPFPLDCGYAMAASSNGSLLLYPQLSLQVLQAAPSGPCCPALCGPGKLLHLLVTSLTHAHAFINISFLKFFSAPHWEYLVFPAGTLAQAPRSRNRKVYSIHNDDKSHKYIEMNLTKKCNL